MSFATGQSCDTSGEHVGPTSSPACRFGKRSGNRRAEGAGLSSAAQPRPSPRRWRRASADRHAPRLSCADAQALLELEDEDLAVPDGARVCAAANGLDGRTQVAVSYTHLRAHETVLDLV